jgi:hypothetical protein
MDNKIRASDKSSELLSVLCFHWDKKMNLARIKFIVLMILSLCKVQTVNYEKLATAFDSSASTSSNLRRIQRFMSNYQLDMDLVARFIYYLLPHQPPYALAMDRTCWEFAGKEINILVLSVIYRGCAFPILFSTCPGKGNSNWKDRAILINRFTDLFGEKSIASLAADREFIGSEWMNYLRSKNISFYLRIKGNYIVQTRSGYKIRIDKLFDFLKVNQQYSFKRMFLQKGTKCYLTGIRFINKEGKQELLVVASVRTEKDVLNAYKMRWEIESAFKALKSSGFNLEDTHLSDRFRIEKLFAIVCMAFTWAYVIGDHLDKNIKPIRILRNGRRAYSIFKYGLNYICRFILTGFKIKNFDPIRFLSCT